MRLIFYSGEYLKVWPNWTGVTPQIGDTMLLHRGDNNEQEYVYRVVGRTISGTDPDSIRIDLEWIDET